MWIKWKYNDHGAGGFKEIEVPDNVVRDYGSVEDYICELGLVPVGSERFMMSRIEWKKLKAPSKEVVLASINDALARIKYARAEVKRLRALFEKL